MLLQLEQECLDVYRRKVEHARLSRAQLHQAIADAETKIAHLTTMIGDHTLGKVRSRRCSYLYTYVCCYSRFLAFMVNVNFFSASGYIYGDIPDDCLHIVRN